MLEQDAFNHYEVHCTSGDKTKCENGKLIELNDIKELDKHWPEYERQTSCRRCRAPSSRSSSITRRAAATSTTIRPTSGPATRLSRTVLRRLHGRRWTTSLGRLVRKLEEIGELENTLIILTSDNGPECEIPPHGRTPFRGCKGSSWEGGVRVPTFAYWKDMIEPRKSDGLFDLADMLPTALSLAGVPGAELAKLFPKDDATSTASTRRRSSSPTAACRRGAAARTR